MKSRLFLILFIVFLVAGAARKAYSDEICSEDRCYFFSSNFCTVFYEEGVNLDRVNRRISLRFSDFYSPRRYTKKADLSTQDILAGKLDSIFGKVQEILDMYPSNIHVTVNVYDTQKGLDAAYEEIFHEKNTAVSFYVYKTNTIYTTQRAITEGILAHEMAHCIIDHYFVVLPPRKIQEMLAVYADVHLKD